MTRGEFSKKKNNTIREGEGAMAGHELAQGQYENAIAEMERLDYLTTKEA